MRLCQERHAALPLPSPSVVGEAAKNCALAFLTEFLKLAVVESRLTHDAADCWQQFVVLQPIALTVCFLHSSAAKYAYFSIKKRNTEIHKSFLLQSLFYR